MKRWVACQGMSGDYENALIAYQKALEIKPTLATSWLNIGNIKRAQGKFDEAIASLEKACEHDPTYADAFEMLGDMLLEQGKLDLAIDKYRNAQQLNNKDTLRVKIATAMPVIMESRKSIEQTRFALHKALDALLSQQLSIDDPATEICRTLFYPIYHGMNDVELQTKIAAIYGKSSPQLLYTAPHCRTYRRPIDRKVKLGIISRFFCEHTIGTTMKGVVKYLPRDHLDVTVFTFPYRDDATAEVIQQHADHTIQLPMDWKHAHQVVGNQQMDVLFYTDVGMDPYTYFLAYARLAPVQCTTWGHPVTTGITNMDWYLTYDQFEPEDHEEHYVEKVHYLSGPPTYYYRPEPNLSMNKGRADYAWNENANLYLCPQTLYKFHPDFDCMIAGILRADLNGQVVLIDCRHQHWLELLLDRFRNTMPDVVNRICVLRYPGAQEYLNLLSLCDVMLDTYHYGGGSTSLQGLAFGTPIVTMPGSYQRGRHTYGYYAKMGYMECVATTPEEYIRLAVRLGTDKDYREKIRQEILMTSNVLYEDSRVVQELAEFFIACSPWRHSVAPVSDIARRYQLDT